MNKNFIEFVKAAQAGDNRAFEALYNMTKDSAYFIALSITKNEQDALDIMQDSYIKAFGGISTLDKPEVFDSWLGRIVANTSKNYITRKKPMLFEDMSNENLGEWNEEEFNKDYLPQESVDSKETSRLLMEIIDRLSEDKRLCILMYYYQEMSVKEISEALELPVTTIKYKLLAARAEIKKGVEDLEKRGTKLYGVFPFALFPAQFKNIETEFCKMYSSPKYSSLNFSVNAASSQAVATEVTKAVVKKGFLSTVAGKVTAVSVAVIIAGSGITAAVVAVNSSKNETSTVTTETVSDTDDTDYYTLDEALSRMEARFISSDGLYICEITDGLISTTLGDRLKIVSYNEPETDTDVDLVVPSNIDGYSVQEIGFSAFLGLEHTRSITLPDSINKLESNAFSDETYYWKDEGQHRNLNPSLKEVVLSDNLKDISVNCFSGCASLEKVTLPKNLESIWSSAFSECTSLKSIEFPDTLKRLSGDSFYYCTSLTEVCIPKSVNEFKSGVFEGCTALERVYFEDGIIIDKPGIDAMFYLYDNFAKGNPSIREIYIPESLKNDFDFIKYSYKNQGTVKYPDYESTKNSSEIEDLKNITFYGKSGSHAEEVINNCGLKFVAVENYEFSDQPSDNT